MHEEATGDVGDVGATFYAFEQLEHQASALLKFGSLAEIQEWGHISRQPAALFQDVGFWVLKFLESISLDKAS